MSDYRFETLQLHAGQETPDPVTDARAIYIGTLGNPNSDIPDIDALPDHRLHEKYFPSGGGSIFTFEIKGGVKEAQL